MRKTVDVVLRNEMRLAEKAIHVWAKSKNFEIANFYQGWMKCCVFLLAQSTDDFKQYVADMKKAKKAHKK